MSLVFPRILFYVTTILQKNIVMPPFRSSRPEVFYKSVFLTNLQNHAKKETDRSLFLNKAEKALLKKRLRHRSFPVDFAKFSGIPFFQNTFSDCSLSLICRVVFINLHLISSLFRYFIVVSNTSGSNVCL